MVATRRLEQLRTELEARLDLPSPPFVVALSGGADSAALAGLVAQGRLLHVHHGQPHSDRLQQAAEAIATVLALPLVVEQATVEPWSEGAARAARYDLLLASLEPQETLLTGHTADDQAETVLAHILRGSGLTGVAGIPRRRGRVARPLLEIGRTETREFATLAGLPWHDDPTNDETDALRNRIRHRLLPELEADYNPAIRSALVGLAQLAGRRDDGLPGGEVLADGWRIPNSMLWAAGPKEAGGIVREALRGWRAGYGIDRVEMQRVWEVVTGSRTAIELRDGLRVQRDGSWLVCRSLPLRPHG